MLPFIIELNNFLKHLLSKLIVLRRGITTRHQHTIQMVNFHKLLSLVVVVNQWHDSRSSTLQKVNITCQYEGLMDFEFRVL